MVCLQRALVCQRGDRRERNCGGSERLPTSTPPATHDHGRLAVRTVRWSRRVCDRGGRDVGGTTKWPILSSLTDADRTTLLSRCHRQRFAKGERIFHEG